MDFFYFTESNRSNTFRFGSDPIRPWTVETLSTVHFVEQWRAAQTKGKGKGKSSATVMDWGTVETLEAGHSPLFTLQNSEEQPKQKRRGRGRGRVAQRWWTEGRWKSRRLVTLHYSRCITVENAEDRQRRRRRGRVARQWERRRLVVKGSYSPLMDDDPSFFPLFLLFSFALSYGLLSTKINRVET